MALPTGQIKFSDLNRELGKSLSTTINLNDSIVQVVEGNPSDGVSMSQLRGKSKTYTSLIATNQKNLNIYNTLVAQGWDKQSYVTFIIENGVYIWSDNISLPALTSGGPFPNGLTIVNKGYIMGKGGAGGGPAAAGESGGPAISITTNVIIDNTYASAYIGGGGGGGGSGGYGAYNYAGGGGGAGGGVGGAGFGSTTYAGGSGGAIGQVGANGVNGQSTIRAQQSYGGGAGGGGGYQRVGGGGGGRIFPGTSGAGGYEYAPVSAPTKYTYAGKGGASNLPGENSYLVNGGTSGYLSAGGGGGWGAAGGQGVAAGGAGGKAVETNSYTVTWVNNNTTRVYGSVGGVFKNPFSSYSFTTSGVDAGGGGPISAPGKIKPTSGSFVGQSVSVPVALTLTSYWADSNAGSQTYNSPRDSVFVSSTTNWTVTDLINLGINHTNVHTTSTTRTVSLVFDVDESMNAGYYIITRSGAVTSISLWATGTYTGVYSTRQVAGGRQRNISGSWTLPILNDNQLLVPAWGDGTGTNNLRWSIT